jgi:hypothetical protein
MKTRKNETEDLDQIVSLAWSQSLRRFNSPLLHKKPKIVSGDCETTTASFDLTDNSTEINEEHIRAIADLGIPIKEVVTGIFTHEIGHYMDNPGEISRAIIQAEAIDRYFPKEDNLLKRVIVNLYSDTAVNLERMRRERDGKELRDVYMAFERHPDTCEAVKLINLFYADRISFFKSKIRMTEEYEKKIASLKNINFFNRKLEHIYVQEFGRIMIDVIRRDPNYLNGKQFLDMMSDFISKLSSCQLDKALDDIAKESGLGKYLRIKRWLKDRTNNKIDDADYTKKETCNIPGLESSKIEWNDHLIDFYDKRARGKGIYIAKKPLISSQLESYPLENERYKVDDPFQHINPFSSPRIMPGVTQRTKIIPGETMDQRLMYPDCLISLDSSGSMRHPNNNSQAVHTGFILALNYYKNGSYVGVINFSANTAMLFPTRDLQQVYSILCAYWGGGTVYDIEVMKEYFSAIEHQRELKRKGLRGVDFSSAEDYQRVIARLDPKTLKKFEKKDIRIRLTETAKMAYEKTDHVLITDGGIYNLSEYISYVNSISKITRNTILVIGNPKFAGHAASLGLENTMVYDVNEKNICDFAIGKVKNNLLIRVGR